MSCDTANSFLSGDLYQTLCGGSSASHYERDPDRIGFMDEIGGSVDGFVSCTETLGSESTDDGSSMDEFAGSNSRIRCGFEAVNPTRKRMREGSPEERRKVKKFPPPLTSLNRYGWPRFVLRPVRKDGRLELTEVKIHRQEILRASRENGRLTIHLVKYGDDDQEEEETEAAGSQVLNVVNEEGGETGSDRGGEEWRLAVASDGGGGDGLRRCYHRHEGAGRNRHGHLDVWSPRCVTTR